MDEKKLCQMLKESAEDIEIPRELCPENIEKRLLGVKKEKGEERWRRWKKVCRYGAAAVLCLFVGGGIWRAASVGELMFQYNKMSGERSTDDAGTKRTMAVEDRKENTAETQPMEAGIAEKERTYVQAEDFGEVYDSVQKGMRENYFMSLGGNLSGRAGEPAVGGLVATDGEFLYVASGAEVRIWDIRGKTPEFLNFLQPMEEEKKKSGQQIRLMYAKDGILQVICSGSEEKETSESGTVTGDKVWVYTYQLNGEGRPELTGTVEQDGAYRASIRNQGYLYLLTGRQLMPQEDREEAVTAEGTAQWLPGINGQICEPEKIWISAEGGMYAYLFSAIDDDDPEETTDSRMVIAQETEIYTAGESFYLSDLSLPDRFSTWITKVQIDCGKIDVKRSLAVDENMELTAVSDQYGCVIDKQEENGGIILDFSDAENPRAAGVFEGMPFPIFQQFWSEDRLLEIGFEEASDGKTEVKLVMMDLSDPYHVQEKHSGIFVQEGVFRGIDLSSVVMDSEKGRIGFLAETKEHPRGDYLVYEYDEERGFREIFSKDIAEDFEDEGWIESIFAGDDVYLVSDKKAVACELPD